MSESKIEVLKVGDIAGAAAYHAGQPIPKAEAAKPAETKPPEAPKADAAKPKDWAEELDENGIHPSEKAELTARTLKAIGKRTARMREAEELTAVEAAGRRRAEERAAQLEKELAEARGAPQPAKDPEKGAEPKLDDFKDASGNIDWDKYIDAKADWKADQAVKRFQKQQADEAEQRTLAEAKKELDGRLSAAMAAQEDWGDVVQAGITEALPGHVERFLQDSPRVGELLYYLATNPEAQEEIRTLRADRALVAIARIEAKLSPFSTPKGEKALPNGKSPEPPAPKAPPTAPAPSPTRDVPVITPLAEASEAQVSSGRTTTAQAVEDFQKKTGRDLYRRRRN